MPANDDAARDPLVDELFEAAAPVLRAAIARAVEEARARAGRSATRAADDELDDPADAVTRARARQILRDRGL